MKNKIFKILGVVLTLALLSSFMVATPASAAADPDVINAWEQAGMPSTDFRTDVGPMDVAPDGTVYATVLEWIDLDDDDDVDFDEWFWCVKKSTDGGFHWKDTILTGLDAYGGDQDVYCAVDIQCSPNYNEDGRVYAAFLNGDIYRIANEGDGPAILLTPIVDNEGYYLDCVDTPPGEGLLYDIDLWCDNDGTVYVLVACSLDVLALEDVPPLAEWIDMDLSTWMWDEDTSYGFSEAWECAFAPDFEDSNRMWAIYGDDEENEFWTASTVSPGQWGQEIDEIHFETPDEDVDGSPYVDIAFPEFYTDEEPVFYAGLTEFWDYEDTGDGNVFLCVGGYKTDGDTSECEPLLPDDVGIVSVEVSGDVILAGAWEYNTIYRSENLGSTWDTIGFDPVSGDLEGNGPTGFGLQPEFWSSYWDSWITTDYFTWTHVYMAPGFDAEDGVAYVSTFGGESAVSKSVDGGVNYAQVGLIDLYIEEILDLAFSPEGGSQPAMMITYGFSEDIFGYNFDDFSLWLTDDIYAEKPQFSRVMCGYSDWFPYSSPLLPMLVEYAQDGSAVMLFGPNDDTGDLNAWKSTDDGHSFSYWKVMPNWITDWEVLDGSTIYCATPDGFYGTSRFGPATTEDDFFDADENPTSNRMLDIALQPGFDPDDEDSATIILSNVYGEVFVSRDAGDNWGLGNPVITSVPGTNGVYLAFDSQFATAGADGEGLIYAADSGNWGPGVEGTVQVGALDDTTVMNPGWDDATDVGFEALEDFAGATATGYFSGLVVSPGTTATGGDALYAISEMVSEGAPGGSYSAVIQTGGSVTLVGDASAAVSTSAISGNPAITPIVGTFVNGEALTVVGSALSASAATTVSGVIVVKGAISGALGQFTTGTLTVVGFTALETVSVTGSDILTTVTGAAAAVPEEPAQLWRLLLHEEENVWENAADDDLYGPYAESGMEYPNGLWFSPGSNLVWAINKYDDGGDVDDTLWTLEDTVPIPITGVTVTGVTTSTATVNWTAMTGAKKYEYKWVYTDPDTSAKVTDRDWTVAATATKPAPTTAKLIELWCNTKYTVKVRVAEAYPFTSRWSSGTDFTTVPTAPENITPYNGEKNAPLLPSFDWSDVRGATSYNFELGTKTDFSDASKVTTTISRLTWATELKNDIDYWWRVQAVGPGGVSEWCISCFHTRMAEVTPTTTETTLTVSVPPAVTPTLTVNIPPQVTPTITVVPPAVTVNLPTATPTTITPVTIQEVSKETPAYIWAIVAIGALLTLAVIVLIIRTRRVV